MVCAVCISWSRHLFSQCHSLAEEWGQSILHTSVNADYVFDVWRRSWKLISLTFNSSCLLLLPSARDVFAALHQSISMYIWFSLQWTQSNTLKMPELSSRNHSTEGWSWTGRWDTILSGWSLTVLMLGLITIILGSLNTTNHTNQSVSMKSEMPW